MAIEDKISNVKNKFLRKFALQILIQLEEFGLGYVANELNRTPDTCLVASEEGIREFISQLLNRQE